MTTRAEGKPLASSSGGYPVPAPQAVPPGPAPAIRTAAARRRTNRKLLILAVLMVLVGGVLALGAGQILTRHMQVLAVARAVQVGARITADDLTAASVTSDPNLSPIPASQRAQVIGMIAQVTLSRGELLTRAQVGTGTGFTQGQMLVALPLKQGQFPGQGLTPGQRVLVVATPGATGAGAGGGSAAGGPGSAGDRGQGIPATVTDVTGMSETTQLTVVDVQVSSGEGVTVAQLASTGNLAVILLPQGR